MSAIYTRALSLIGVLTIIILQSWNSREGFSGKTPAQTARMNILTTGKA
jgi:hypothetical protein